MISLNDIPSTALKQIITLVEKREKLEREMETLLKKAKANIPPPPCFDINLACPCITPISRPPTP